VVNDYDVILLDRDLPPWIHGDEVCAKLIPADVAAEC
jgi:hypothetical protein